MDLHKISRWCAEAIVAVTLALVFFIIEFAVYKLTLVLSGALNFVVHFVNAFFMLAIFVMVGYSCVAKSKRNPKQMGGINWLLLLLMSIVIWYLWLADSFFLDN